jgi:AcrR family transcriptional regulator
MSRRQKVGQESSATRAALLDAAELSMQEEGYAAVTSRRLGAKAGVTPQLVHYYFRTMDDLFLALIRRRAEQTLRQAAEALDAGEPLRVLWEQNSDPTGAALNLEFMALANHRKVIRAEMAKFGEQLRAIQRAALEREFSRRGIDPQIPPAVVTVLMASVGRILVLEQAMGMSSAHEETRALVEAALRQFETTGEALPAVAEALSR